MASCPECRHIRTNCYYYLPTSTNPTQTGSIQNGLAVLAAYAFMKTMYGYQLFIFI